MTDDKVKLAIEEFCLTKDQWSEHLSGAGTVYYLERKFADLVGKPHSIAVANATLGLWAVFEAYNIHDADVITSPYTWGGSIAGLLKAGNKPVFADIDSRDKSG